MTSYSDGHLWSLQLIKMYCARGVKTICIAPGSRSTCLVKAASEIESVNIITHYDERSLGFFALGCAKYDRVPVIVITTSGSAVSNLVPSATEAHAMQIPIIYITADRPPELHHCGANQTIEQEPLLKHLVTSQVSVVVEQTKPAFDAFVRSIKQTLSCIDKGPIHINIAFREPFLSNITHNAITLDQESIHDISNHNKYSKTTHHKHILKKDIIKNKRVLCIIANTVKPIDQDSLLKWAKQYHVPILAECSSTLAWNAPVIRKIDKGIKTIIEKSLIPDYIICIGAKWISKSLQTFLNKHENVLLLHDFSETQNYLNMSCIEIMESNIDLTRLLPKNQAHKTYHDICQTVLKEEVSQDYILEKSFTEQDCIKALKPLIQQMKTVFLGNSLTVRHINDHLNSLETPVQSITQRGVSGIDGLISTTAGLAYQEKKSTMGIIGDLSFFYDVGGLSLLKYASNPTLIIVINNKGGQIFNKLDIKDESICQALFVMPQTINIKALAAAYSCAYTQICNQQDLISITKIWASFAQSHIIECMID